MVKLKMPLMSQSASGSIAKFITYSERKSGSQVRWQLKQKDKITPGRTTQRNKFKVAKDMWKYTEVGVIQPGYYLLGGKDISISSLPKSLRSPKFACFVRDVLTHYI